MDKHDLKWVINKVSCHKISQLFHQKFRFKIPKCKKLKKLGEFAKHQNDALWYRNGSWEIKNGNNHGGKCRRTWWDYKLCETSVYNCIEGKGLVVVSSRLTDKQERKHLKNSWIREVYVICFSVLNTLKTWHHIALTFGYVLDQTILIA